MSNERGTAENAAMIAEMERLERQTFDARVSETVYFPETVVRLPCGAVECDTVDFVSGKRRKTGLMATAKSDLNRALFARIEGEMGDDFPPIPEAAVSLDDAVAEAFVFVDSLHAEKLTRSVGNPTQTEINTWPRKLLAARGVLSGNLGPSDTLMLEKSASARNLTLTAFAEIIIAKDEAYAMLIDEADKFRENARYDIKACESVEQLNTLIAQIETSEKTP